MIGLVCNKVLFIEIEHDAYVITVTVKINISFSILENRKVCMWVFMYVGIYPVISRNTEGTEIEKHTKKF